MWAFTSEDAAKEHLYGYVADWWEQDGPEDGEELPKDHDAAIEAYFDRNGAPMEFWSISGSELTGAIALDGVTLACPFGARRMTPWVIKGGYVDARSLPYFAI